MALSGSVDFKLTAQAIIEDAMELIGYKPQDQPLDATGSDRGIRALNLMLKTMTLDGHMLWKVKRGVLFPTIDQASYTLGPSGDRTCLESDFEYHTLNGGEPLGETSLAVNEATTNIAASDIIGIALADGTRQWTTVASKTASTIVVDDTLTAAASDGASIFSYTTLLTQPKRLYRNEVRRQRYTTSAQNEIVINPLTRSQYARQPDKISSGTISGYYFEPSIDTSTLYLWEVPSDVNEIIKFNYESPLEDIDDITDNVDIPQEFTEAIIYNLAARLTFHYPVSADKQAALVAAAQGLMERANGFDQELLVKQTELGAY